MEETLPILFGGLFFIVCLVRALGYVVSAKRKDRARGLRIGALGLLGLLPLLPLLLVLPPANPTLESVAGTYEGTFGGGKNTFVFATGRHI